MKKTTTQPKNKANEKDAFKEAVKFESWLIKLGLNIALLREERGLSQVEFGKLINATQSVVARIESGQNMTCSTIWKISEVLNVGVFLFGVNKDYEKSLVESYSQPSLSYSFSCGATSGPILNKVYSLTTTHLIPYISNITKPNYGLTTAR